jgi:hypothetical protein
MALFQPGGHRPRSRKTLSPWRQSRIRSKVAIPSSPHATASPSMMQERGRSGDPGCQRLARAERLPFF